jgi:hypothetical protein
VRSWETHAGDEFAKLSLRVDGQTAAEWSISAQRGESQDNVVQVRLKAGKRSIAAHFTNDFYEPNVADRNLAIETISIAGPLDDASTVYPLARREILAPGDGVSDEVQRVERMLHAFASRAYRRPVTQIQLESLSRVYQDERVRGVAFEPAWRTALSAALVSPSFLFRTVNVPEQSDPAARHTLDGYELASRLSYFLWSSTPDAQLLSLAGDGSLLKDAVLIGQVRRMLEDERSDALVENFTGQWLQLRTLNTLNIDSGHFPEFNPALRDDMITEATLFFQSILRSDRSMLDLIDSRDSFLNERLASLYGIPDVKGDQFRQVKLGTDSPRGGILTMGAILTLTSNTTRTSPVKRGLFVLDQILGAPPPPPPADIPPLEQAAHAKPDATVREQLAIHTANASCAACHNRLDPLGLTFENFDAIGKFRTTENGRPIDSSGTLPGGIVLQGTQDLKRNLMSRSDQFIEALAAKLMTYALGRGMEPFDRPAVRKLAVYCRERGDRMSALIEAIALSESFRTCRARSVAIDGPAARSAQTDKGEEP